MKDELGGKIMIKFVGLRAKTYSYLIDDGNEDKKAKCTKTYFIKIKFKFGNYKNYLEATELDNKINYLKKIKIDIKTGKLILQTQQRFNSERYNVFTEEINKIALRSNDDKRVQSIDWIETYSYGTSKNVVSEKEEIKCSNIIKRCKK